MEKEISVAPPEETGAKVITYPEFMSKLRERQLQEYPEVGRWFAEKVAALPEMFVKKEKLTGKGGWAYEMDADGAEVEKITNQKGFFDVEGYYVDTGKKKQDGTNVAWNQAGITQKETAVTIPTPEGEVTTQASGFVGVIKDEQGRILLSVGQEPLADTEKKVQVRTPLQTSAAKLQGLLEGKRELDEHLADVLDIIGNGKTPHELFQSGDFMVFPLAYADANRIKATNIGFSTTVSDPDVQEKLATEGRRWCTPEEIQALVKAGVVNGHTIAAIFPNLELPHTETFMQEEDAA